MKSRREFIAVTSLSLLGAAAAQAQSQNTPPTPGAPPAFGTAPEVGPEVSAATFAEAEKLLQFEMNAANRNVAADSWRRTMASVYERRTGPRKAELDATLSPATLWNPILPGLKQAPERDHFVRSNSDPGPLPSRDEDIAFSP